ncbi:MAG: NUDIX hydrolase [Candidatus Rokubacteria bacterium]|nr:NUDIX hydrolase [Candidatus Rokubacteria bacterium]
MSREYPDHPRVGVGAVVLHGDKVLLVRRGGQPSSGKWSLPGGLVELGETTADAIRRELQEECAIEVELVDVAGVIDRVVRDRDGRIRYHYVLVDYLALAASDIVCAGSDAAEAQWVAIGRIGELDVTDGLMDMIERALALQEGRRS